ncbi:MAG: hypothetical protein KDA69_15160, partial [Planctomycetaceae bacterium]|nr:hypothetical protein [Planctomycetaceae bacterium]
MPKLASGLATIFVYCSIASITHADDAPTEQDSLVEDVWTCVKEAVTDLPDYADESDDAVRRWDEAGLECVRQFKRIAVSQEYEKMIRPFVRKFGTEGDLADVAWLMCSPNMFMPWFHFKDARAAHIANLITQYEVE